MYKLVAINIILKTIQFFEVYAVFVFSIHNSALFEAPRLRLVYLYFAGLVSRSILIDLGLFYRLFQKNGLYLVYILMKSLLFHLKYLFILELLLYTAS